MSVEVGAVEAVEGVSTKPRSAAHQTRRDWHRSLRKTKFVLQTGRLSRHSVPTPRTSGDTSFAKQSVQLMEEKAAKVVLLEAKEATAVLKEGWTEAKATLEE